MENLTEEVNNVTNFLFRVFGFIVAATFVIWGIKVIWVSVVPGATF